MTESLRPILTMSDVYGPDRIYAPRAHEQACAWLPTEPTLLDSFTGSQITVAGEMPIICSEGFNTQAGDDLLASAGFEVAPNRIRFRAGQAMEVLSRAAASASTKLVLQHAYPQEALSADRYWIDPALLRYLNDKANLAQLASPDHVPRRTVVDRECFFAGDKPTLPVVIKASTDQSSGGGYAVMICRNGEELRRAAQLFEGCSRIVIEQSLDIVRNPCLSFAVMPSGETRYLGFADQEISNEGKFRGNWMDLGSSLSEAVVAPAMDVVRRAATLGFRGFAGVDMVISRDGRIYVLDLNFRLNASTVPILLAAAIKDRCGTAIMHIRKFHGQSGAKELARIASRFLSDGRLIPMNLFDAEIAGHLGKPSSMQALIVGASQAEVLATEEDLAAEGVA